MLCISSALFSQKEENQLNTNDSIIKHTYSNEELKIYFSGPIEVLKNTSDNKLGYFFKSNDVIRFTTKEAHRPNNIPITQEVQRIIEHPEQVSIPQKITDVLSTVEDQQYLHKENHLMYHPLSSSFSRNPNLSTLFVLPKKTKRKVKAKIRQYVNDHELFQISGAIKRIKIKNKKVLSWRLQNMKTRLDHFMVFGKNHNYLFVSSPYGSNNRIEAIIAKSKYTKYIKKKY
ncbi:hypothetical protein GCM10022259_10940 [Aquimarina mytili]